MCYLNLKFVRTPLPNNPLCSGFTYEAFIDVGFSRIRDAISSKLTTITPTPVLSNIRAWQSSS